MRASAASTLTPISALFASAAAPIRVGVVGQGRWGSRLTDALRASRAYSVEALCDLHAQRPPLDAAEFVTPRVEEILGRGLHAIFIATSPASHAELAIAALESGHHVFVEKPCALSTRDAERICHASERAGRVAGVGHLLRHHESYERLVALVHSGTLGASLGVVAERVGSRPRSDADSWWMLAPHDLSVLFAMFGVASEDLRRWRCADDEFVAFGSFGGTPTTFLVRSGGTPSRRLVVVGSRLTALLDDLAHPKSIRLVPTHATRLGELRALVECASSSRRPSVSSITTALDAASREDAELLQVDPTAPPLERELAAFAAAIREGRPLSTDAREGLAIVRMLEMATREKRSPVTGLANALHETSAARDP